MYLIGHDRDIGTGLPTVGTAGFGSFSADQSRCRCLYAHVRDIDRPMSRSCTVSQEPSCSQAEFPPSRGRSPDDAQLACPAEGHRVSELETTVIDEVVPLETIASRNHPVEADAFTQLETRDPTTLD
jgi:hypothetical protein